MPARTVTDLAGTFTATSSASADSSTRTPSVAAAPVNECPAPTARTVLPAARALVTSAAISSVLPGRATRVASACWLPAQFVH